MSLTWSTDRAGRGHTEMSFPECTAAKHGDSGSLLGSEVNEKAEE